MLRRLVSKAYLERRRLLFVTVLAFCAGALFYVNIEVPGAPSTLPLITGLAYAALVGPAALLTCMFLPAVRFMVESVAVSRLIVAMVAAQFPDIAHALVTSPLLMAAIVVSGGSLLSRLLHGRFLRRKRTNRRLFRVLPLWIFQRRVPVLAATPAQRRFVTWIDATRPISVSS